MSTAADTAVRAGVAALMLLLLSCSRSNTVPQAPPAQTHTITIDGMRFDPADVTVRPGDTLVWVNKDLFAHTATAEGVFDSRQIDPGGSWRVTLSAIGAVPYICALHPTMKATVRVMAGAAASRSNIQ